MCVCGSRGSYVCLTELRLDIDEMLFEERLACFKERFLNPATSLFAETSYTTRHQSLFHDQSTRTDTRNSEPATREAATKPSQIHDASSHDDDHHGCCIQLPRTPPPRSRCLACGLVSGFVSLGWLYHSGSPALDRDHNLLARVQRIRQMDARWPSNAR